MKPVITKQCSQKITIDISGRCHFKTTGEKVTNTYFGKAVKVNSKLYLQQQTVKMLSGVAHLFPRPLVEKVINYSKMTDNREVVVAAFKATNPRVVKRSQLNIKKPSVCSVRVYQLTTLLAQLLLAKASGLALKANPIPSM